MSRDAVVVGTRLIQQEFNIKAGKERVRGWLTASSSPFVGPTGPQSCSWRVNFGG